MLSRRHIRVSHDESMPLVWREVFAIAAVPVVVKTRAKSVAMDGILGSTRQRYQERDRLK